MRIDGGILTYQPNARHLQEENTPKGRKVMFLGFNGTERDQQKAKENLEIGEIYTVEEIYVDRYSSEVRLQECPRYLFNTVLFEDYEPEETIDEMPEKEKTKVNKGESLFLETLEGRESEAVLDYIKHDSLTIFGNPSLKRLNLEELLNALYIGYEVTEIIPEFEPGDLAMYRCHFVTLDKWVPEHQIWICNGEGWTAHISNLKKPTQDEIYWLHDLKRDCVNDFRVGDVIITKHYLEIFVIGEEDMEVHNCTISDAIEWANLDNIKAIYPADSRKPYRKEEN